MPERTLRERLSGWWEWLKSVIRGPARKEPSPSKGKAEKGKKPSYSFAGNLVLVDDPAWNDVGGALDPNLRLAVSLIEARDRIQLFERTGVDTAPKPPGQSKVPQYLPLHIEFNADPPADTQNYLQSQGVFVPSAYFDEAAQTGQLRCVTARLILKDEIVDGKADAIRSQLLKLGSNADKPGLIKRISLAGMIQPFFRGAAFDDIKMPVDRKVNGVTVDGNGVVVGIIDDGCAFAHLDFVNPGTATTPPTTRVLLLWDQSPGAELRGGGWVPAQGFPTVQGVSYGAEIPKADLDAAIAARVVNGSIDEDKVYADISYDMADVLASHGTHVMGIAASNGKSSMGFEGIAPAADIIFVQLPKTDIAIGMSALTDKIQDGVAYIFTRAAALGKQAVINISYGGYTGPHDGTSQIETGIDYWPAMAAGRAVVISAGNGFEADCHAHVDMNPNAPPSALHWIVHPFDATLNFMQLWYNGNTTLELSITTPGGQTLGPIKLGDHKNLRLTSTGPVIGYVDHQTDSYNGDRRIDLTLRPTYDDPRSPLTALPTSGDAVAPAPSGIWALTLKNTGNHKASIHAWIERDDAGRPSGARRRQSQFVAADADAKSSVAGLATGLQTIAVGGYNTGTHEVCRYSACGPTRPIGNQRSRHKPDVCAPAEDDARGRGVLSASSRKSRATRMNGTSAAAPHVTGLVALLLQYRRDKNMPLPNADQIRDRLKDKANPTLLRPNRHNEVDATRLPKLKQSNAMQELIGGGRIDILNTLN